MPQQRARSIRPTIDSQPVHDLIKLTAAQSATIASIGSRAILLRYTK